MALEMRLDLKLQQKLVMTPQLQQAIRLLQLSRLELSQIIQQELMENPVLEESTLSEAEPEEAERPAEEPPASDETGEREAIDVFGMRWDNYIEDDSAPEPGGFSEEPEELPSYDQTISSVPTLAEHLRWQLRLVSTSERQNAIGEVLIGNIDDDGYLRGVSLDEVAAASGAALPDVEKALALVQDLDPPGVGARDLRECLLIQARQLGLGGTVVERIIAGHIDELEKKRFGSLARKLRVPLKEVVAAAEAIESFEPKPGRPFNAAEVQYIIPDVYVVKKGGEYVILLNDEGLPRLRISSLYKRLMRSGGDEGAREYIETKMRSAQWLLKSIEQRNRTIYRVAESIVKYQREYFDRGVGCLKPMVLRDVAEDIGMHESTISRVTTSKYMHSPQGIHELKYFFSGGITGVNGEELSCVSVRRLIEKMIGEEDPKKPYNDRVIVDILGRKNIRIARRTVAKYRCELKIPPANLRKRQH